MAKNHISIWLSEETLRECEANMANIECPTRSKYIEKAIQFYNGYLHDKNNEQYVSNTINKTIKGMLDSFERRMAKLMFKQAVETAKVFWLIVKGFDLDRDSVDDLHYDCIKEVQKINGAIRFPFSDKEDDE